MIWLRLELAYWLDLVEQKVRRLGEKLGWPQKWLAEFIAYRGDPRMTIEEFWVRFTLLRIDAEEKYMNRQLSEAEAREFYTQHQYQLWRNLVHRRHVAWRRVTATMRGTLGHLLEFGCGVAPVVSYVHRRGAGKYWQLAVDDLAGPAYQYARWRGGDPVHEICKYDVITALDVCEHLADPLPVMQRLVRRLGHGGYMHWNVHFNESANDLDLASREQLDATARYLESVLEIVWKKGEYVVGRKR